MITFSKQDLFLFYIFDIYHGIPVPAILKQSFMKVFNPETWTNLLKVLR